LHTDLDWMQHFSLCISMWCHESNNVKKLSCQASICSVWCALVCICPKFPPEKDIFSWLVDSLALLIIYVSLYIRCYFLRLYSHLLLFGCYGPYSFTLASLMISIHSVWSWAFLLHPLFPIILRSACMSSSHVNFGLPTFFLPSTLASRAALGILLFPFLLHDPAIQDF